MAILKMTSAALVCLLAGNLSVEAQYKATLSTPIGPLVTQTGRGDVFEGVELRAVGGGYAWGQYKNAAVKVSLADGSITSLESTQPLPGDFSAALVTNGVQTAGYTGGSKR